MATRTPSTVSGTTGGAETMARVIQDLQKEIAALKDAQEQTAEQVIAIPARRIKTRKPEPFSGEREKLQGFLTQTKAYLKREGVLNEESKVEIAGTLLTGAALVWFEPTLRDYLDNDPEDRDDKTKEVFGDFEEFEKYIKGTFGSVDEKQTAEHRIKNLKQKGSATRYASEFQQQAVHLEWDDEPLISIFYDGLREDVKDELMRQPKKPNILSKYIEMVVQIDNRLYDRKREKHGFKPMRAYSGPTNQRKKNHPKTENYGYEPMDWQASTMQKKKPYQRKRRTLTDQQRAYFKEGACLTCGEKGHFAKECQKQKSRQAGVMRRNTPELEWCNIGTCGRGQYGQNKCKNGHNSEKHDSLHWTACYHDNCSTHYEAKTTAGRYPQKRTLRMMRRVPIPEQDPRFKNQEHKNPYVEKEDQAPFDRTKVPDRLKNKLDLQPRGTHSWVPVYGTPVHNYDVRPVMKQTEDSISTASVLHHTHPQHHQVAWISCIQNQCVMHLDEKLKEAWFPKRYPGVYRQPYEIKEIRHYEVVWEEPENEFFVLTLKTTYPMECLRGKRTDLCMKDTCKVHAEEKSRQYRGYRRLLATAPPGVTIQQLLDNWETKLQQEVLDVRYPALTPGETEEPLKELA